VAFEHPYLDGAHHAVVEATGALAKWHHWTAQHSLRVMKYAVGLGRALELDDNLIDEVGVASLLHDIGKTSIPVDVLNKPDTLSPGEWSLVRAHPQVGAEIACKLGYSNGIAEMILGHHEHWNGRGYPFGFAGSTIPLGARLITVADVFDALTTPRSYRGPVPPLHALDLMSIESGTILDPEIFVEFHALVLRQLESGFLFGVPIAPGAGAAGFPADLLGIAV
jgi:putative nucleotidyltransferase with HDIG domain